MQRQKKILPKKNILKKNVVEKIVPTTTVAEKTAKPEYFAISVSKIVTVPLTTLFGIWTNDKVRGEWLTETVYIHKEILNKSLRFDWFDGSPIEVNFDDKGSNKAQVVVQHSKLPNAEAAEKMKFFWQEGLERMLKVLKSTYGAK